MNNKEIELKYGVIGKIEDLAKACADIGKVSCFKTDNLKNFYYDTKDHDLYRMKTGLRVRQGNDFCEQTLKIKSSNLGGLHIRQEYNLPYENKGLKPDLKDFDRSIFPQDFDLERINAALKCVGEINFERQSAVLEFENCLLEICYDNGEIQVDGKTLPINEFEVELLECKDDIDIDRLFYKLSLKLSQSKLPLTLEPFSKMHKASLLQETVDLLALPSRKFDTCGLDSCILSTISHFETLFGLLMYRKDLITLSYFNACSKQLAFYLKEYSDFIEGRIYDVNANIDEKRAVIKETCRAVRKLHKYGVKKEHKIFDQSYDNNFEKIDACTAKLRKLISDYDLYNLTLKMRYALSLK